MIALASNVLDNELAFGKLSILKLDEKLNDAYQFSTHFYPLLVLVLFCQLDILYFWFPCCRRGRVSNEEDAVHEMTDVAACLDIQ